MHHFLSSILLKNFFHVNRNWKLLHTDAIYLNYPKSNCLLTNLEHSILWAILKIISWSQKTNHKPLEKNRQFWCTNPNVFTLSIVSNFFPSSPSFYQWIWDKVINLLIFPILNNTDNNLLDSERKALSYYISHN